MVATSDPGEQYAQLAAGLTFEHLPSELVTTLKQVVLDTLGTTLAGGTLGTGCAELVDVVSAAGGTPESTIIGFDRRVSAPMAALANGATAHALNYDDVFPGGGHLGVVTVPAALAMAERQGGVTGRDFLAALAAGAEIMARLQLAVRKGEVGTSEAKPQPTQILGAFAAAASAARVLDLGPGQTWSALGLALMQANGNRQPVLEGTPAKALYAAFPNQGGVLSALLAQRGVGAQCALLEGEAGFFPTFYGDRYHRLSLVDDLGREFYALQVGFKPWPTTGRAHIFIQAALNLHAAYYLDPVEITHVQVQGGPQIRTFCEPLATRLHPRSWVEAEDSMFFPTAKALMNGAVTLADFTPEGLGQPEVVALGDRMSYAIDPGLAGAGVVEVALRGGQVLREQVSKPLGHPDNPLSGEALKRKFMDCGRHAPNGLSRAALERVVETVDQLETLADVRQLVALLSRSSASL